MTSPEVFLKNNYDLVKKRCRDNGIDDPNEVLVLLESLIGKLENVKLNNEETRELISKWLSKHKEIEADVYSDLLFRSVEGDPSYVYVTNFFIQRMNRKMHTNIPLRDDRLLKTYQAILSIKDISIIDVFIVSSFPNPKERYKFLWFLFNELSEHKGPQKAAGLIVSKTVLLNRVKRLMTTLENELNENGVGNTKNKLTAGQKALIIYCRYRKAPWGKTLRDTIQGAHEREGWKVSSFKNIKNLYDAIGKGTAKDPATDKNLIAISGLLSEAERKEALSVQRK